MRSQDIKPGMYLMIAQSLEEERHNSPFGPFWTPPGSGEKRWVDAAGGPLEVIMLELPYLIANNEENERCVIDTRKFKFVPVSEEFVRAAHKSNDGTISAFKQTKADRRKKDASSELRLCPQCHQPALERKVVYNILGMAAACEQCKNCNYIQEAQE